MSKVSIKLKGKPQYDSLAELEEVAAKYEALIGRPQPEFGRYGRYKVIDRNTGEVRELQRATTLAGKLDDKGSLVDWKARKAIEGLVRAPADYIEQIAAIDLDPEWPESGDLKRLIEDEVMSYSGGNFGSRGGSAHHTIFEADDMGMEPEMPEQYRADLLARRTAMTNAGIVVVPELTEAMVVNNTFGVAGRMDRGVRVLNPEVRSALGLGDDENVIVIFDDKTGEKVHPGSYAAQEAIYATADFIYDPVTYEQTAMPLTDRTRGIIAHTPIGQGRTMFYAVDLTLGFDLLQRFKEFEEAKTSWAITRWERPAKELEEQLAASLAQVRSEKLEPGAYVPGEDADELEYSEPTKVAEVVPTAVAGLALQSGADPFEGLPSEPGTEARDMGAKKAWLTARIETIKTLDRGVEHLVANWPPAIPPFKVGDAEGYQYSSQELEIIDRRLWDVEGLLKAPFPETVDPTDPAFIKVPGDDDRVLDLKAIVEQLPADLMANVAAALKSEKIPQPTSGRMTEAQLPLVDDVVRRAHATAANRAERCAEFLAAATQAGADQFTVLTALGVKRPEEIDGVLLQRLQLIVAGLRIGWLKASQGALVVDQPMQVLARFDNKKAELNRAAKAEARRMELPCPNSADEILVDPLLVACLTAA